STGSSTTSARTAAPLRSANAPRRTARRCWRSTGAACAAWPWTRCTRPATTAPAASRPSPSLVCGPALPHPVHADGQLLHRRTHAPGGVVVGRLDLQVVRPRTDVVGQAGRAGILVVHARHKVRHFRHVLDPFDGLQQVGDRAQVVLAANDAEA